MQLGLSIVTYLRLVRLSSGATANLECLVTVYQSRFDSVTINPDTSGGNVSFSNTLYETTQLTQAEGLVGIGTDTPNRTWTVSGNRELIDNPTQHSGLLPACILDRSRTDQS